MTGIGGESGATVEVSRRSRLAALPAGALGMVALVVAVEAFVAAHEDDLTGLATFNWRYSAQVARGRARDQQILCLGTSLTKCGVQARVVAHGTGRTCFNLAVGNGRIASSYYLLKRALEAGARPAAILVDCIDGPVEPRDRDAVPEALQSNWRNWPELLTLRDAVELALAARSADFLNSVLLTRTFPSYRTRFEIRTMLQAIARREKPDDARLWLRVAARNWDINQGTLVGNRPEPTTLPPSPPQPQAKAEAPVEAEPAPGADSSITNRLGALYTRWLLELAQAHGITVFWVLPPFTPAFQAERSRNGSDAYFVGVARAAMAEFPNVVVIDGRRARYPACRFPDGIHLGRIGGYTYSADLAAVVQRHLAAPAAYPRWNELPRYRDLPIELPIEDLNASARIVWSDRQRRHGRSVARHGKGGGEGTVRR